MFSHESHIIPVKICPCHSDRCCVIHTGACIDSIIRESYVDPQCARYDLLYLKITYALSGHDLNVAVIFSSLQFFNVSCPRYHEPGYNRTSILQIIRTPLFLLPLVLNNTSDAIVALGRISKFLLAEELAEPYKIDLDSEYAVEVDGDFAWETVQKPDSSPKLGRGRRGPRTPTEKKPPENKKNKGSFWRKKKNTAPVLPTATGKDAMSKPDKPNEKPFELNNIQLRIPKGSFVAVVGRVGSGKVRLGAVCGFGQDVERCTLELSSASPYWRNEESSRQCIFGLIFSV